MIPVVAVVEVCRGVECLRREADAGSGFPRVPSEGGVFVLLREVALRVRLLHDVLVRVVEEVGGACRVRGGKGARHRGRCGGGAVTCHLPVTPFGVDNIGSRCTTITAGRGFWGKPQVFFTSGCPPPPEAGRWRRKGAGVGKRGNAPTAPGQGWTRCGGAILYARYKAKDHLHRWRRSLH